ncbi:MAG: hypothetical protein ACLR7U_04490 [Ruthenibacterium lactatiformans]
MRPPAWTVRAWQCFWRVTLPGLLPTLFMTAVFSLLNTFKVFRRHIWWADPHDPFIAASVQQLVLTDGPPVRGGAHRGAVGAILLLQNCGVEDAR